MEGVLLSLLLLVVVVGVALWLINLLPVDARAKQIARIIVVIIAIIWLLRILGVWGGRVVG